MLRRRAEGDVPPHKSGNVSIEALYRSAKSYVRFVRLGSGKMEMILQRTVLIAYSDQKIHLNASIRERL